MKNPNGYGSIIKLSGKRRKPYAVRVTEKIVNTTKGKKQVRRYLGTYATKKEADARLLEYNMGSINLETMGMTFREVKERWEVQHYKNIGKSTIDNYEAAFKLWEPLHNTPFEQIRHTKLQEILDATDMSYSSKSKMRALVGLLYKYALVHDIVNKNYSESLNIGKQATSSLHKPFTEEEIKALFNSLSVPFVDAVLIQIHTGMRSIEISGNLEYYLDDGYVIGGSKTKAGRNRVIPLHENIQPLVEHRYNRFGKLFDKKLNSSMYAARFNRAMKELGMDHTPHDTRHTFATVMDRTEANHLAVKRILGHSGSGVTEKVYTHKDIHDLKKAISYFPDFSSVKRK